MGKSSMSKTKYWTSQRNKGNDERAARVAFFEDDSVFLNDCDLVIICAAIAVRCETEVAAEIWRIIHKIFRLQNIWPIF